MIRFRRTASIVSLGLVAVACTSSSSDTELKQGTGGGTTTSASGTATGSGAGTTSTGSGTGAGSACAVFPADNWWNTDISNAPVDPLSDQYIASIGLSTNLHPDFGSIYGIPFVDVDNSIMKSSVIFQYADESDPGPYPIPPNPPIEGGSDHHILMVQTNECVLYELFAAQLASDGWHAGSGAIWDLKIDATRPAGWTSADAAGLPIYPGLARYDEAVTQGAIHHALRFTAASTQAAYVAPASHYASSSTDSSLPPMGLRVRLKASVDVSAYSPEVQVILTALKHYGMFLADNGSDWYISGAPDMRWSDDNLNGIKQLTGSDFEAIATGPLTH